MRLLIVLIHTSSVLVESPHRGRLLGRGVHGANFEPQNGVKSLRVYKIGESLTPMCTGCTLALMPPSNTLSSNDLQDIPAYRRPADRRTTTVTFRIYQDQVIKLRECYDGTSQALVRFLLDKYFNGEVPELVKEFHNYSINNTINTTTDK